jgi:endo-1,4-beta-mannosidase
MAGIVMVCLGNELIVWSWYGVQIVEAVDDARLFSGGDECYIEVMWRVVG